MVISKLSLHLKDQLNRDKLQLSMFDIFCTMLLHMELELTAY